MPADSSAGPEFSTGDRPSREDAGASDSVPPSPSELYYEQVGNGRPLLLIPDFPLDHRMWSDDLPIFARHARAISYDPRGCGRSPATEPGARLTTETDSADLLHLFDALSLTGVVLLASGTGCQVALTVALAAPKRVGALLLAAPNFDAGTEPEEMFQNPAIVESVAAAHASLVATLAPLARTLGPLVKLVFAVVKPEFAAIQARTRTRMEQMYRDNARRYQVVPGASWLRHPHTDPLLLQRMESLALPVVVLVPERADPVVRESFARIRTRLPHAELVVVPRTWGALMNLEQPEAFQQTVLAVLARL